MNILSKQVLTKIKNGIKYSFAFGFLIGCIPNNINLRYGNFNIKSIYLPLISGIICSTIFCISPLIMINYFFNVFIIDKSLENLLKNNIYIYISIT